MDEAQWHAAWTRAVALFLGGDDLGVDQRRQPITDGSFYLMFNAHAEPISFTMPLARWGARWRLVLDTNDGVPPRRPPVSTVVAVLPEAALANAAESGADGGVAASAGKPPESEVVTAGSQYELAGRSLVLLERVG
jgi:glycogen operon protein